MLHYSTEICLLHIMHARPKFGQAPSSHGPTCYYQNDVREGLKQFFCLVNICAIASCSTSNGFFSVSQNHKYFTCLQSIFFLVFTHVLSHLARRLMLFYQFRKTINISIALQLFWCFHMCDRILLDVWCLFISFAKA